MADPIETDTDKILDSDDDRRRVIIEKHVHTQVQEPSSSFIPFIMGFLLAAVLACAAALVFLAVSDSDDDGNIDFDVPEVDLDVGN